MGEEDEEEEEEEDLLGKEDEERSKRDQLNQEYRRLYRTEIRTSIARRIIKLHTSSPFSSQFRSSQKRIFPLQHTCSKKIRR